MKKNDEQLIWEAYVSKADEGKKVVEEAKGKKPVAKKVVKEAVDGDVIKLSPKAMNVLKKRGIKVSPVTNKAALKSAISGMSPDEMEAAANEVLQAPM